MAIVLLALLAWQTAAADKSLQALQAAETRSDAVMRKTFTCMDGQVKVTMLANVMDATPESVTDAALTACGQLKDEYAAAETAPEAYISADKARGLADSWWRDLRRTYVKHIEETFVKPDFAQARSKVAIDQWRKCVTGKAAEWSRLRDEAATVGQAAVTACEAMWPRVQRVLRYEFKSKGLPVSLNGSDTTSEKLHSALRDVATETVISERAKRLPKH